METISSTENPQSEKQLETTELSAENTESENIHSEVESVSLNQESVENNEDNVTAESGEKKSVENEMETEEQSLRLVLEPDTETMQVDKDVSVTKDVTEDNADDESWKLELEPDTEVIPSSPAVETKASSKAWARLQALKNKLGDTSDLEKTLQITPRLGGSQEDLVVLGPEQPSVSKGAQKLIEKFYVHAKASKGKDSPGQVANGVQNLKIVSKKVVDGKEVLVEELLEYKKDEKKEKMFAGKGFVNFKEKLKKDMMDKKKVELLQRKEMIKMNNEEDGLPEDEEVDDEEVLDEEYENEYDEDEEEGESEPEEDDVPMKERKRGKSAFVDDEAEDEDEDYENDDDDDDDNDSLALEVDVPDAKTKRGQFRKIIQDPELMSESSNQSDLFR